MRAGSLLEQLPLHDDLHQRRGLSDRYLRDGLSAPRVHFQLTSMSNTRRFRRSRPFGIGPLALALVGTQMASCACSSEFRACATPDSCAAGASGDRGIASGGGEQGGMPVGGFGGAGTAGNGGNGEAGDAGAAGCAEVCKGTTPVCDTTSNMCVQCVKSPDCKDNAKPVCDAATNTCVQCTKGSECTDSTKPACDTGTNSCVECVGNGDCKDSTKPLCDTTGAHCVACLKQADCTSPTASACNASVCTACTTDAECSNIAGKGVCDAGTCVQCTGKKFAACGQDSGTPLVCDSLKKTCSKNKQASAGLCKPCVSDAQCENGEVCVLDRYGSPAKDVGYFCHWKKGDVANGAPTVCSSSPPYAATLAGVTSVDGAVTDICTLNKSTCVALGQFAKKDCTVSNGPDDSLCGFAPTKDSKCALYDTGIYRCTMTCGGADEDCPGTTCDNGKVPFVCTFQ